MKHLILSIVVLLSSVVAVADPGLTAVQKDRCLMMEFVTDPEDMLQGVHYTLEAKPNWSCGEFPNDCFYDLNVKIKYRYLVVMNYDHFNYAGQRVSSSVDRKAVILEQSARGQYDDFEYDANQELKPKNAAAEARFAKLLETMGKRMERQIASILMESPDPACAGSYYQ
jgi:hypothetical protein